MGVLSPATSPKHAVMAATRKASAAPPLKPRRRSSADLTSDVLDLMSVDRRLSAGGDSKNVMVRRKSLKNQRRQSEIELQQTLAPLSSHMSVESISLAAAESSKSKKDKKEKKQKKEKRRSSIEEGDGSHARQAWEEISELQSTIAPSSSVGAESEISRGSKPMNPAARLREKREQERRARKHGDGAAMASVDELRPQFSGTSSASASSSVVGQQVAYFAANQEAGIAPMGSSTSTVGIGKRSSQVSAGRTKQHRVAGADGNIGAHDALDDDADDEALEAAYAAGRMDKKALAAAKKKKREEQLEHQRMIKEKTLKQNEEAAQRRGEKPRDADGATYNPNNRFGSAAAEKAFKDAEKRVEARQAEAHAEGFVQIDAKAEYAPDGTKLRDDQMLVNGQVVTITRPSERRRIIRKMKNLDMSQAEENARKLAIVKVLKNPRCRWCHKFQNIEINEDPLKRWTEPIVTVSIEARFGMVMRSMQRMINYTIRCMCLNPANEAELRELHPKLQNLMFRLHESLMSSIKKTMERMKSMASEVAGDDDEGSVSSDCKEAAMLELKNTRKQMQYQVAAVMMG